MADNKNIILASGGTGGHIFPAVALAAALKSRGYNPILVTDERYSNYAMENSLETRMIKAGKPGGKGIFKLAGAVINMVIGYFQARSLLKQIKPLVVVGFGGYPSFPTMMAATRNGFKTIIHEQNSLLGRANHVLSSKVDYIATSFQQVIGIDEKDSGKIVLTGNPVRAAIKILREMPYPDFSDDGILKILITGGSQGASVFSKVVPEAMRLLPIEQRKRIRIDQQCRKADIEEVKKAYDELNVSADIKTFFNDIPARLASSHLVIARAGASTIAEIAVAGRPAILVPYPHAKDDHQTINANAIEDTGGGWLVPEEAFTKEALAARIESILNLPDKLKDTAKKISAAGIADADKNLADLVEKLAK